VVAAVVGLALVALVLGITVTSPGVSVASGPCPILRGKDEVPAWLWELAITPGRRLADIRPDEIAALEAPDTVEPVVFHGAPPEGVDAWVIGFGFAYDAPGTEVFTYSPVVCLGGRVPEVRGSDAEQARALVQQNGLVPQVQGDSRGTVRAVDPPEGTLAEFWTAVTLTVVVDAAPGSDESESQDATDQPDSAGESETSQDPAKPPGQDAAEGENQGSSSDGGREQDIPTGTGDRGSPSALRDQAQLLADWWWVVVAAVATVSVATMAVRTGRRVRERRWVERHLRLRAEAGREVVSVAPDEKHGVSHAVRLAPHPHGIDVSLDQEGARDDDV
jgi:hypothetical protein